MERLKVARGAGLGMLMAVLLGALEAGAADTQAKATTTKAAADTKVTEINPTGKANEPGLKEPKERGSETAAPLLERAETEEAKAKRLRYARAMKAKRAATTRMDSDYMKAVVEREQARQVAEKAKKTHQETPANVQEIGAE